MVDEYYDQTEISFSRDKVTDGSGGTNALTIHDEENEDVDSWSKVCGCS